MGTRAVYTFKSHPEATERGMTIQTSHHVYKHWDGYPAGAAQFIKAALATAWPLPRYEADEFAASFVAANKTKSGDVRLTAGPQAHGDLSYRYEIEHTPGAPDLHVRAYRSLHGDDYEIVYDGSLEAMIQAHQAK